MSNTLRYSRSDGTQVNAFSIGPPLSFQWHFAGSEVRDWSHTHRVAVESGHELHLSKLHHEERIDEACIDERLNERRLLEGMQSAQRRSGVADVLADDEPPEDSRGQAAKQLGILAGLERIAEELRHLLRSHSRKPRQLRGHRLGVVGFAGLGIGLGGCGEQQCGQQQQTDTAHL